MNTPQKLTRKELYDLVWSEPLTALAKRFAITDRGLAKKCDYYNIPRPPQGHWVRLECGHAVEKTPLPAVGDGTEESIYLHPASESEEKASEAPCLLTEEQLAHAMEFRIPERVGRYNDNVRACRNDYRSSKVLDKYGRIIFDRDIANPGFKVTPKTFDRASLFLHGLLKLCQDLGWKLVAEENWRGSEKVLAVSHSGECLHFQLKEPVKQIDHKKKDRDSYWGPKYDYVPLGTLELSICSGLMKPDTNMGGKIATREVFNGKTKTIIFNRIQA